MLHLTALQLDYDLKPRAAAVLRASAQQPTHAHTQHGSQLFFFFFKRKKGGKKQIFHTLPATLGGALFTATDLLLFSTGGPESPEYRQKLAEDTSGTREDKFTASHTHTCVMCACRSYGFPYIYIDVTPMVIYDRGLCVSFSNDPIL